MRTSNNHLSAPEDIGFDFYEALQQADLERLMACWTDEDGIVCVHSGAPRLVGYAAVRAAFEAVFVKERVNIQAQKVCRIDSGSTSVHSVIERVEAMGSDGPHVAWVVVTNVYVKTIHDWRLVARHASPGTNTEPVDVIPEQKVLH